jgi:hypothetical protein
MQLMFVYYQYEDAGSAQDILGYIQAARALGHDVVVYGQVVTESPFNLSLDVESADAVIFIFEWTTELKYGDRLDLVRLMGKVPRERRVVIDCDGNYNDIINVIADYNHRDTATSRLWIDLCDSLSDKICQPTLHPLRDNVRTFFFHAYNPEWEVKLDFNAKAYGMVYVGHNKFRWHAMYQVLRALEPIRKKVGRIGLIGHGWDALPSWAIPMEIEDVYYSDPSYLKKLNVEVMPPIPVKQVIGWMSKANFNPVIYRPLFNHLKLVTCRTFETPAANTIPLLGLDETYVQEIYGDSAIELVLADDNPQDKFLDVLNRPNYYADIVMGIRQHLAKKHSYAARIHELIQIIES